MRRRKKRRRRRWKPPELSEKLILGWADALYERTGLWPRRTFGRIPGTLGETWSAVNSALRAGLRGLPGGSSLARLLAEHRGVRNPKGLRPYTVEQILAWADAHHERTGHWPTIHSGPIPEAPGETWQAVHAALSNGKRGMPGGSSLPRLLAVERGARNIHNLPDLTPKQILRWIDAYQRRTGEWPTKASGPIPEAPGETWQTVDRSLREGVRGLSARSSLAQLLAKHRGVRNPKGLPPLRVSQILTWADAYRARTGQWPTLHSGPIPEAPGEDWAAVDHALRHGVRSLPSGSSLARLLAQKRGVRNKAAAPPLTVKQILAWADAHYCQTGRWPRYKDGVITRVPQETWNGVDAALRAGGRGLPGGSSLARLLAEHRGVRNKKDLPRLTVQQILAWADAHYRRTGDWPTARSGPVADAPGETWGAIDMALYRASRGLPGGTSLCRLLEEHGRLGQPGKQSRNGRS